MAFLGDETMMLALEANGVIGLTSLLRVASRLVTK
jgi:hypothetical protein